MTEDQVNLIIEIENLQKQVEILMKNAICVVNVDAAEMIKNANDLPVPTTDEDYEEMVELKRLIKRTHIEVQNKRNEVKAPFIQMSKRIDAYTHEIYTPLVEVEKSLKDKIQVFIQEEKTKRREYNSAIQNQENEKQLIDERLHKLNALLAQINHAEDRNQLQLIEFKLNKVNLEDFGNRSDEAGFILSNLKLSCDTKRATLPEIEIKTVHPDADKQGDGIKEPDKDLQEQSALDFLQVADGQMNKNKLDKNDEHE